MSNPTRSVSRSHVPDPGGKRKANGKLRKYQAPTILTYTDDRLLRELSPAKATRTGAKHV